MIRRALGFFAFSVIIALAADSVVNQLTVLSARPELAAAIGTLLGLKIAMSVVILGAIWLALDWARS